jgi:hypothetical protein
LLHHNGGVSLTGDAGKWTSLYEIGDDGANGYCFRGGYNSYYSVGRLEKTGEVPSFYRTGHTPRDVRALSEPPAIAGALLTVGAKDVDGDGGSDVAYVSLVSPGGNLLDQQVYSADTSDVSLYSVAFVSDSAFVAMGGLTTTTATYPFIASFVVTGGGEIQKKDQVIVTDLPQRWFIYAETDNAQTAGPDSTFFAATRSETDAYAIHKITLPWPSLTRGTSNGAMTSLWRAC